MRTEKSTRHAKITGDFGESLVLYLLSKTGFECANVDHTGIDLIARRPRSSEVMGISVKSRSRAVGKEGESVNVEKDHFEKIEAACKAFKCVPYIAFVVDEAMHIRVLVMSVKTMLKLCPSGSKVAYWSMSKRKMQRYRDNKNVMWLEFDQRDGRWWT